MMIPDLINGSFELLAGGFAWTNVAKLAHDKEVKGVYVPAWVLFTLWGLWNLYYYPSLNQWASFFGGLVIVSANIAWLGLVWHHKQMWKNHMLHFDNSVRPIKVTWIPKRSEM